MRYFDCHADTLTEIRKTEDTINRNERNLDLERVHRFADQYGQIFAVWEDMSKLKGTNIEERFLQVYHNARNYLKTQEDKISFCTSAAQMKAAFAQGKDAAFLSIEDLSFMGKEVENITQFGFRFALLTWNYPNQYGVGAAYDQSGRLTADGKEMVEKLTRQGIIMDISHLSDAGVEDLLTLTDKPIMASHSNVRDICAMPRNLTKEQVKEVIRRKGLIGMNFFRRFVGAEEKVAMDMILKHMDVVLSLGGEESLALGSDFDGSDDIFPEGILGVESIPLVAEAMKKADFGSELIDKIVFKNAYRFIERNL